MKLMRGNLLLLLSIAIVPLLSSGCSQGGGGDEPDPVKPDKPETEKLEIKIRAAMSDSRATDYGFETDDCIGLYVVNYNGSTPGVLAGQGNHVDNMRFRYTSGSWVPDTPVYWADQSTHADFYLYYPYSAGAKVSGHLFAVKSDQSTQNAYQGSDFMIGKTTDVSPTASATEIRASRVMSRIVIALEAGNGFTKESLAASDIKVKINGLKCTSEINIATGEVKPSGTPTGITPFFTEGTYRAFLVPQTVESGSLITVTVDGIDYNLKKSFTFESGHSYKFTVTLSRLSNGVNVNINPWIEDGIDNGGIAE